MQNIKIDVAYFARLLTMGLIMMAILAVFSVENTVAQVIDNSQEATFLSPPIGITPGQSVRVSVVNPLFADGSVRSVRGGHVKVFNGSGELLYEMPVGEIRPGAFHHIDINYSDLNELGELTTGRLQMRAELKMVFDRSTRQSSGVFPPSFELVNEVGGQSILIGLLLPAVQK